MHMTLGDLFRQGGVFMIPLLAASVLAVAVFLERLLYFMRLEGGKEGFQQRLGDLIRAGRRAEAITWLQSLRGPVPGTALAALQNWDRGRGAVESAMASRARVEGGRLHRFLNILETTVTASPLIGLLGTITGMMGVFRQVSERLGNNPQADTSGILAGIGEALIATATGIMVAVVCLVIHNLFQAWAESQMDAAEATAENILLLLPEPATAVNGVSSSRKEEKVAVPS